LLNLQDIARKEGEEEDEEFDLFQDMLLGLLEDEGVIYQLEKDDNCHHNPTTNHNIRYISSHSVDVSTQYMLISYQSVFLPYFYFLLDGTTSSSSSTKNNIFCDLISKFEENSISPSEVKQLVEFVQSNHLKLIQSSKHRIISAIQTFV